MNALEINELDETVGIIEKVEIPETEPATTAIEETALTERATETKTQPFPAEDYKDGKLKPVRKRMLKKLLKYEFRALFPYVLTLAALLIGFATIFGIHIRLARAVEELKSWLVLTGMLYVFANFGVIIVTFAQTHKRYKNNFFSGEGYLTFSIPATADEHILAKHIATLVCMAISWAAMLLGGIIFGLISEGFKTFSWIAPTCKLYGIIFKATPWHTLFFTIELFLLSALFIPLIPCLTGAGACWGQKHNEKSRFKKRLLYIILFVVAYNVFQVLLLTTGLFSWVFSEWGLHVFLWIWILIEAGATVWGYYYQRKTLKCNLNLQ